MILAGLVAMVVYGSLYPFDFCFIELPGGALHALLSTWPERTPTSDMLANILFYFPFGFCAVQSFRAPRGVRLAVCFVFGVALSMGMELLQLYDAGRWASMADVRANALGTLLGTIAGLVFERIWKRRFEFSIRIHPFLLLLLLCWAGYRLFPYEPVTDPHKYWHAIQPLLHPVFSAPALYRHCTIWLAVALMLEQIFGAAIARPALPALLLAILGARILIDTVVLSTAEVAGGALAVLLWEFWLRSAHHRARWIAALFAGNLLVHGLEPFHFSSVPRRFEWIPFYGFLAGEPQTAVPSFFEKAFLYGTLLWLLVRSGIEFRKSLALGSTLLLAISLVHLYIPGRSAEITDVALFLCMAVILRLTRATSGKAAAIAHPAGEVRSH